MNLLRTYILPHPPLIVDDIGKDRIKDVKKTVDNYLTISKEISVLKPETIVIISPHALLSNDCFNISSSEKLTGSFKNFGHDEISFKYNTDLELVNLIEEKCITNNYSNYINRIDSNLDHGSMVPLYYINKFYKKFKLVIISFSNLPFSDHFRLGIFINNAIEKLDKKTIVIASGDLSHRLQEYGAYGYHPSSKIYDKKIVSIMKDNNFLDLLQFDKKTMINARECGHRSFVIMAGILSKYKVISKFYSHEDITGVGYLICKFIPQKVNNNINILDVYLENIKKNINNTKDEYVNVAYYAIKSYLLDNKIMTYDLKSKLNKRCGVFVSIYREDTLRGCIGTYLPIRNNIYDEIIHNAISAAFNDRRFSPITIDELDYLTIKVDEIYDIEEVESITELDSKKYGIIVKSNNKRGLLLPDIDGIDSVDDQISIACRKGNITKEEDISISRFKVIRHI